MFVLFLGVSCVGKNELITELTKYFNWRYVPTYMTRPLRENEIGKISVSKKRFIEMEKNGNFICVNNLFKNFYGTPKKEVIDAVNDERNYWVLDFPISKKHLLKDFSQMFFIILPESVEQLKRQIESAERADRLPEIMNDYNENYSTFSNLSKIDLKTFVVVNKKNRKIETAKKIDELARKKI